MKTKCIPNPSLFLIQYQWPVREKMLKKRLVNNVPVCLEADFSNTLSGDLSRTRVGLASIEGSETEVCKNSDLDNAPARAG